MEPEVKRSPYFGPLPVTESAPGPDLAYPPLNVPPQPISHQPIRVEQDEPSNQTNSDWRQKQSMQPLLGAVPPPEQGFAYQAPNGPPPILHQPVAPENWKPQSQGPSKNCPYGLEHLSMLNQLVVNQTIGPWEGSRSPNKYNIKNSIGQDLYSAKEVLIRNRWGQVKPCSLDLTICDNSRTEVIHLFTPSPDGCCSQIRSLEVSAPPGNLLGTVQRESNFWYPTFTVKNAQGDTFLRIKGPCVGNCCWGQNEEYRITTPDGSSDIGKISKLWDGFLKEMLTCDNFGVSFPVDSDVETKAILLGALFFIDITFYEGGRAKK